MNDHNLPARKPQNLFWIMALVLGFFIAYIYLDDGDTSSKRYDCVESEGGSCLKVVEYSFRHNHVGDYDQYEIIGQVQNVGSGKDDVHPWHGIEGTCYANNKVVDTGGSTFDLLQPNETTTFKIGLDGHNQNVEKCTVKVTY